MAFYAYYSTPLSVDKLNRIEEPTRLFPRVQRLYWKRLDMHIRRLMK